MELAFYRWAQKMCGLAALATNKLGSKRYRNLLSNVLMKMTAGINNIETPHNTSYTRREMLESEKNVFTIPCICVDKLLFCSKNIAKEKTRFYIPSRRIPPALLVLP